jgi:hypothetical protein
MEVQDAKLEEICVLGKGSGGCSRVSLGCCAMYDSPVLVIAAVEDRIREALCRRCLRFSGVRRSTY